MNVVWCSCDWRFKAVYNFAVFEMYVHGRH